MVVISSKTERGCDEKYEKIVQVCMNWTICSAVFVDTHILQTAFEKLGTFLLHAEAHFF